MALAYWSLVFLGALDIELLDFDGDFDLDVDVDVDVDGAMDGALDGAMEGMDGAFDGADAAEAAEGTELEPTSGGPLAILLGAIRVKDVPVTVTLSFMTLAGWAASWLLARFLLGPLGDLVTHTGAALALGAAAAAVAVPVGRTAVRPLSGLFHTEQGTRRSDLIGQTVQVVTGKVTETFGQGELTREGTHLVVEIRCPAARGLTRDSEALLVSWDPVAEAFVVEPMTS